MSKPLIAICGGGNASHVLSGYLSYKGYTVNIFAPFADEAQQFKESCFTAASNGISVTLPVDFKDEHGNKDLNAPRKVICGKPNAVSKEAKEVIEGADVVIMPIPAFALDSTMSQIAPYLKKNAIVGALPGNGGFHWSADKILRKDQNRDDIVIFGSNQLPLNCRTTSFGNAVNLLAIKKRIKISTIPAASSTAVASLLSNILEPINVVGLPHMLNVCLYPANQVIHSARLYDLFENWVDGKDYLEENPLFYGGFTDKTEKYQQRLSDELQNICKQLDTIDNGQFQIGAHSVSIYDAMMDYYGDMIADSSRLKTCFTTNLGYVGLTTPMNVVEIENETKYVPNWNSRYFTEDIPHGLCLAKGIAQLIDVDTPFIDDIIVWFQSHSNKEYLVKEASKYVLKGKHLNETGAPQRYKITSINDALHGYHE